VPATCLNLQIYDKIVLGVKGLRRIQFNLNIFIATFFNEWRKDMSTNYQMTAYFSNDVILSLWRQTAATSTIPRSWYASFKRHQFSSWKFWVYYEVKRTVIKFWIC